MGVIRETAGAILHILSGIYNLMAEGKDFKELEEGVAHLAQEGALRVLAAVLEEMDEELSERRDSRQLRLVHFKRRSVVTPLGVLGYKRRYYKDVKTGEMKFLLDEALGLEKGQRLSPWAESLCLRMAVDMPYHRASKLLEEMSAGAVFLSPMSVWEATQRAGRRAKEASVERRRALYEYGEIPPGARKTDTLGVEADEVMVRGRVKGGQKRSIGVKLGVAYEGKRQVGKERRALTERQVTAGVVEGEAFWEEKVADAGRKWDLSSVGKVTLGGDGAKWITKGLEHFPGAVYRLDPYHLNRALREGLGHSSSFYAWVCEAISGGERDEVDKVLKMAARTSSGKRREKVSSLRSYLLSNWEGIRSSEQAQVLGAIEGQVFHTISRRMKRHGARWSVPGADHLSRLLAARANGELTEYEKPRTFTTVIGQAAKESPTLGSLQAIHTDPGEWLRSSLPALVGPDASRPWVKWVLRQISHIPGTA